MGAFHSTKNSELEWNGKVPVNVFEILGARYELTLFDRFPSFADVACFNSP